MENVYNGKITKLLKGNRYRIEFPEPIKTENSRGENVSVTRMGITYKKLISLNGNVERYNEVELIGKMIEIPETIIEHVADLIKPEKSTLDEIADSLDGIED